MTRILYLPLSALALTFFLKPATADESKELRKQRQVAQKERQAQKNERSKEINEATRAFREYTRDLIFCNAMFMQTAQGGKVDQQEFMAKLAEINEQKKLINIEYSKIRGQDRIKRRKEKKTILAN